MWHWVAVFRSEKDILVGPLVLPSSGVGPLVGMGRGERLWRGVVVGCAWRGWVLLVGRAFGIGCVGAVAFFRWICLYTCICLKKSCKSVYQLKMEVAS